MSAEIIVVGRGRTLRFSPDIPAIQRHLQQTAAAARTNAITALHAPKSGRIYRRKGQGSSASLAGRTRRKKGGIIHQASAPGEAPASDTGTMVGAIRPPVAVGGGWRVGALLNGPGGEMMYPKWLEEGTAKIAARPWLRPAVEKAVRTFAPRAPSGVKAQIVKI